MQNCPGGLDTDEEEDVRDFVVPSYLLSHSHDGLHPVPLFHHVSTPLGNFLTL